MCPQRLSIGPRRIAQVGEDIFVHAKSDGKLRDTYGIIATSNDGTARHTPSFSRWTPDLFEYRSSGNCHGCVSVQFKTLMRSTFRACCLVVSQFSSSTTPIITTLQAPNQASFRTTLTSTYNVHPCTTEQRPRAGPLRVSKTPHPPSNPLSPPQHPK